MRRYFAFVFVLGLALGFAVGLAVPAFGSATWAKGSVLSRTSVATFTTGTESAPSGLGTEAAPVGMSLSGISGFTVHVEADGTMTSGGKLLAYLYNPETAQWNPVSDGSLDLTVSAVQYQVFSGFAVFGGNSRIAYVPSGVGVGLTIYIEGAK